VIELILKIIRQLIFYGFRSGSYDMSSKVDVAIIGAGPFGLSVASHLLAHGVDVRVFGLPMQTWRDSMPHGMRLKSEGFATNISDPKGELTLEKFCQAKNLPYAHTGIPVTAELFADYGNEFQRRFVPDLERKLVMSVELGSNGFDLRLNNNEALTARNVVIAVGIKAFDYLPSELRGFSEDLVTHSCSYGDAAHLAGKEVIVVGAGSSATDTAALLRARGAKPSILTRRSTVNFQTPLGKRSLYDEIKAPMTGLGPGWKAVLCVKAPLLFHAMPEGFRVDVVRRFLGPAPGWFVRDEVEGHIPYITRSILTKASAEGGRIRLSVRHADNSINDLDADHVIAATGYRVDVDRLAFLSKKIRSSLRRAAGAPALSRQFESSIPSLYFVGTASANSFGPMMRFAYGAEFTARRLIRHLAGRLRQVSASRTNTFTALGAERS
jgi:thioredoxin reductase